MDEKIKVECDNCGLELSINRSYWETECASQEEEARVCPLCYENRGLNV